MCVGRHKSTYLLRTELAMCKTQTFWFHTHSNIFCSIYFSVYFAFWLKSRGGCAKVIERQTDGRMHGLTAGFGSFRQTLVTKYGNVLLSTKTDILIL